MSDETRAWVWEHSPHPAGPTFCVQFVMADIANPAYNYEVWFTVETLARRAHTSARSVQRALAVLVEEKYLSVIEAAGGRKPNRYKVEKGCQAVTPKPMRGDSGDTSGVTEPDSDCLVSTSSNPSKARVARRRVSLPRPFLLNNEMRAWAAKDTPDIDLTLATKEFVNYWLGDGGLKVDWIATWRNSMLRQQKFIKARSGGGPASGSVKEIRHYDTQAPPPRVTPEEAAPMPEKLRAWMKHEETSADGTNDS